MNHVVYAGINMNAYLLTVFFILIAQLLTLFGIFMVVLLRR
jgi:hypothetical protein